MTADAVNVSRETLERLTLYHDLVLKWSPKINLISKSSMPDIWNRHIWDSVQVFPHVGASRDCVDLGSGGGFPGLVLAILAKEDRPDLTVRMIESDVRKATFLRTVIRELDLAASVDIDRIETANPAQADVLTARALADLAALLAFSERHLAIGGKALFLKGETWEKEVEDARKAWSFDLVAHKSKTNPQAAVLEVREIERV